MPDNSYFCKFFFLLQIVINLCVSNFLLPQYHLMWKELWTPSFFLSQLLPCNFLIVTSTSLNIVNNSLLTRFSSSLSCILLKRLPDAKKDYGFSEIHFLERGWKLLRFALSTKFSFNVINSLRRNESNSFFNWNLFVDFWIFLTFSC